MTAPQPIGPWTHGDVILDMRDNDRVRGIRVGTLVHMDDRDILYYSFRPWWVYYDDFGLGMATASDDGRFHPVVDADTGALSIFKLPDTAIYGIDIRPAAGGWEMLYSFSKILDYAATDGNRQTPWGIGYAVSDDGLNWTPIGDEPFLVNEQWISRPQAVVIDDQYYLYYVTEHNQPELSDIGLATGTITRAGG